MKFAWRILLIVGILIAGFGAGSDYLLPGASPGLNLPQILVIVAGVAISFSSFRLRRFDAPSLSARVRRKSVQAVLISLITLLILEVVLTVVGMPTFYPTEFSDAPLAEVSWWSCDEQGCLYKHDATVAACENGELRGRSCIVNQQGYPDVKDFTAVSETSRTSRILFLGDSFTRGFSADIGKSYVETVENNLPEALVWNAAIGGTGTNQAVATFANLGPLFQPHLTILGFYLNDFRDNLFPLDSKHRVFNEAGQMEVIRHYYLDDYGNAQKQPVIQALADFARAGRLPIPNTLERLVGNTRLGSLALELLDRLEGLAIPSERDPRLALETKTARELLHQLKQNAASLGSDLLVLIINQRRDLPRYDMRYELLVGLLEELGIPYLDTSTIVETPGDYAPLPDIHWNNSGHLKVGALLSDCVDSFISQGMLDDCSHVVLP
ncbi:MAG: SGNH/GDSL hydrolase family protein [Chloroflexi bacterium]|nr:SGNH/GDSL hydrolase family protein [Chloroflexota bacterium]